MKILAIETSCDETAVSILQTSGSFNNARVKIPANIVSSQVKIHAKWGGVVPSLAKREHQKNLVPILMRALKEAKLLTAGKRQLTADETTKLNSILEREPELLKKASAFLQKYKKPKIDIIAVTNGPGLEPALWVGVNFAKILSLIWNKPILAINHMEGHLLSAFLKGNKKIAMSSSGWPAIALLVSGGHTELVLVKKQTHGGFNYKQIGQTRDDAAGEAFDKVAKMLALGYPGGPIISKIAGKTQKSAIKINLPRPMINSKDYDFSFSGLKTAVLYKLKEFPIITPEIKTAVCAEFQNAVIETLISKTLRAAKEHKTKTIILGGGVTANKALREKFKISADAEKKILLMPEIQFTGDNAAMIALAAFLRHLKKEKPADWRTLKANGNLKLI